MKFLKIIGLATAFLWCVGLHAETGNLQKAIEAYDIKVVVSGSEQGYVLTRECAACPFIRLDIDSKTAVIVDGKPARISKRIEKHWSDGYVIYDTKTKRVLRMGL